MNQRSQQTPSAALRAASAARLSQPPLLCPLLEVEFPLLSLYADGAQNWLYLWCDRPALDALNRWILFPVSAAQLLAYLNQAQPLRALILEAPMLWLADFEGWDVVALHNDRALAVPVSLEALADYLPSEDSFFDESLVPDLSPIREAQAYLKAQLLAVPGVATPLEGRERGVDAGQ
jgi:hypothetical protein